MIEMAYLNGWPMNPSIHIPDSEPSPLLVCQYCGFVRDDESRQRDQLPVWIPMKAYRENREVRLSNVPFVHIYCPGCSQRLRQKNSRTLNTAHRGAMNTSIGTLTLEWIEQGLTTLLKTIFNDARRS